MNYNKRTVTNSLLVRAGLWMLLAYPRAAAGAFAYVLNGPTGVPGLPGELVSAVVEVELITTGIAAGEPGAQGWSIAVAASNGASIIGATTQGTAVDQYLHVGGSYNKTERNRDANLSWAVSAVVLSFTQPVTLPPGQRHVVLSLRLEGRVPPAGSPPVQWRVFFQDDLRGSGEPVFNRVNWNGETQIPDTRSRLTITVPAEPAPRVVTTLNEGGGGSLRHAIATAYSGAVIEFAPDLLGKIALTTGPLSINKPLSITGPGSAKLAISGNNYSRVFHIGPRGDVTMSSLTITEGRMLGADGDGPLLDGESVFGAGVYNEGTLNLINCMITSNRAQGGRGGNGQVGGALVSPGNGGAARGGAIYSSGTLSLIRCTMLNNVAQGGDGGDGGRNQFFTEFGNGGIGRAAFGGAIWNSGTAMRLENCTLSDNHARGGDGGLAWPLPPMAVPGRGGHGIGGALSGAFALESCTIAGNSADAGTSPDPNLSGAGTGGGAASEFPSPSSALNTIIAGNTVSGNPSSGAPDAADAQSIAPWTSLGWNLIGIASGSSGWTATDLLGNDTFPINPLLSSCQDHGGPVWTICPIAGSLARDTGRSELSSDARGGRRVVDHPNLPNGGNGADIGSLEIDSLLSFLTLTKSGTEVRVRFMADPGNSYRLQRTGLAADQIWTNTVSVPGQGRMTEAVHTGATGRQGFYRVRSVAPPAASQ